MKFSQYDSIYFLGIGGIGMSALARWFRHQGLRVAGYDRTPTPLTHELMDEAMEIHFDDNIQFIPGYITKERTLVIFTPAIPKDHKEYNYLKEQGFTIMKRSEVLGLISKDYQTVAVAGTHGKTTTSSMVAHILHEAGRKMVAFLGGITANYSSNLIMQGEAGRDTIVVAEADEFDRSFLRLFPDAAIVTSADADHLDIYGDHASMLQSYRDFVGQIRKGGQLVIHEHVKDLAGKAEIERSTYAIEGAECVADRLTTDHGFFTFDIVGQGFRIDRIKLGIPGFHNVENALAAALVTRKLGVSDSVIRQALESFRGVKRRFEFVYRSNDRVFVDDYAHHPAEIEAFLKSLKAMYGNRKVTAIFQPHLFTRTRDFADGFAKSLSLADELLLMDIYPARELPIPGVTSDIIWNDLTCASKMRVSKSDLLARLEKMDIDVLATIGAGDIDTFVKPIREMMEKKYGR